MILVTGGTGLLGSHLLFSLVQAGETPRAIKRKSSRIEEVKKVFSYYSDNPDSLFSGIEWVDADILIPESLDEAFRNVDRVYHVAAQVSFDPRDHQKMVYNNQEGTANIVNACLANRVKKLLHVSSTAALGSSQNGSEVTEEMIWSPEKVNTGYSVSKFRSEMEVWRGMEEGLNAVIVNPSIILGPGFWDRGSSAMFSNVKKGLKFYTCGITGYVGVGDVVDAMIRLMNSDISGERFILNSENLSYRDVFSMMARSMGIKEPGIEATPFLGGLAWRLDAVRSWFGMKRVLTKEAIRASQNKTSFSNQKIKNAIGMEFRQIMTVIQETAPFVP